jgi:cephalosporin hydroxylase
MLIDTTFIDEFNKIFYETGPWATEWCRVPIWKNPLDLWAVQTIIFKNEPDVIIEAGTYMGGSALYYAMLFDMLHDRGTDIWKKIYSIDIEPRKGRPRHERIHYVNGNSADPKLCRRILDDVVNRANFFNRRIQSKIMVILDSDHSEGHVSAELELWAPAVSPGQYLIVEDTNVEGPAAAVDKFLKTHDDFVVDVLAERFLCTFNPRGFLKKKGEQP